MRTYDEVFNLLWKKQDWQIRPILQTMPEEELWMIIEEESHRQRNFEHLAALELVRRRRIACQVMSGQVPYKAPRVA